MGRVVAPDGDEVEMKIERRKGMEVMHIFMNGKMDGDRFTGAASCVSTGLLQTSNAYMALNGDYTKGKLMEMDGGWGKSSSGIR